MISYNLMDIVDIAKLFLVSLIPIAIFAGILNK